MARMVLLVMLAATSCLASEESVDDARILVSYDSRTGNTQKMAEAIRDGIASVSGVAVILKRHDDVSAQEILGADAIVAGSPVHWASLSAETKSYLDRVASTLTEAKQIGRDAAPRRRLGGAFVTGGTIASGKELARITILSAFLNMRFVVAGAVDADGFGTLGPQATTGDADPGLSDEELDEARRFGRRIAEITLALRD